MRRQGPIADVLGYADPARWQYRRHIDALYIKDMLQRHSMQQCRVAGTSLDTGYQVTCGSERCIVAKDVASFEFETGYLFIIQL